MKRISDLKSQISEKELKFGISDAEKRISDLRFEISERREAQI
jgi:hypothetical protein